MENKASGLGIAAFVISLIAFVIFCLGVLAATLVEMDDPLAPDEAYAFAGVIMIMGCFLSLISGGLGWELAASKGPRKHYP